MIRFKFSVYEALETAGITSYTAIKYGVFSQETWRKIKKNDTNISMKTLNNICKILNMQPEHLIEYVPDDNWQLYIWENLAYFRYRYPIQASVSVRG